MIVLGDKIFSLEQIYSSRAVPNETEHLDDVSLSAAQEAAICSHLRFPAGPGVEHVNDRYMRFFLILPSFCGISSVWEYTWHLHDPDGSFFAVAISSSPFGVEK